MRYRHWIPAAALVALVACESPSAPGDDIVRVTGTVRFMSLEGGFWAVRSDDGVTYDPINLPAAFQREGLRVLVEARMRTDLANFHMVGSIIEIIRIQVL